ncbi:MAG: PilZ domain-containing protein [Candidatus Thiodiazotropha sp. (ex Semelilucina semeliformis)]|nr:PilZ domain-containing protein [Candidatus Thiodiazotropha sp. (ex Semelilucina semeliformis)]
MNARKHPRTKTSFQVTLTNKAGSTVQTRIVNNISHAGFFVSSLTNLKKYDEYELLVKRPASNESMRLPARVSRVGPEGCGFEFLNLQTDQQQLLNRLINPDWDGKDLLEGVMMYGPLEETTDFAACMRLTSLLGRRYKRSARAYLLSMQQSY